MAADKQMIAHLNTILKNELTAINQYFMHSKMLRHMGLAKLAAKEREESIDEMKHAEDIMERILFLGGLPNLQDLGKLHVGENPQEMLQSDLKMEEKALADLAKAIDHAESVKDTGSVELLEAIYISEENHVDWLSTQLRLIEQLGIKNYLQTQV